MSPADHSGLGHWKSQRLSSLLLVPLTLWLLWAGVALTGAGYDSAVAFFRQPFHAAMALLTAGIMVHHAQGGIAVVCEDYVAHPGLQSALIWLTRLGCLAGFLATVYTIYVVWQGS